MVDIPNNVIEQSADPSAFIYTKTWASKRANKGVKTSPWVRCRIQFFRLSTGQIRLWGSPDRWEGGRLWHCTGWSRKTAIGRNPRPVRRPQKIASTSGWPARARSLPYQREDMADRRITSRRNFVVRLKDEYGHANCFVRKNHTQDLLYMENKECGRASVYRKYTITKR